MSSQPALRVVDDEAPKLVVVNIETGEQVGPLDTYLAQYENEARRLKAKLTMLTSDREAEARKHKLWAEAEAAHEWWRLACWHPGVKFGSDEFHQALPRLKERDGLMKLLKAITGAAYDPGSKRMRNGNLMYYDDFELICRSKAKLANFAQRVPGGEESETWKRWLLERIESHLSRVGPDTDQGGSGEGSDAREPQQ